MSFMRVMFLLSILTGLFLAVGYAFAGPNGLFMALFFALIFNFGSYWYSDKIVLKMYKAKKADTKEFSTIHKSLEKICKKAEIPVPPLYFIETATPNAFATGRSPKHAAIAITRGLMEKLNKEEAEAVIAHEIGHIKNRDTLISTMAATIAGALTYFSYMFMFGNSRDRGMLSMLVIFIVAPLAATLIKSAITRSREFGADKTGAKLSDPLSLANALEKISSDVKQSPLKGNEATAHLFIINPFRSGNMMKLFSTHPPTEERVNRLRSM